MKTGSEPPAIEAAGLGRDYGATRALDVTGGPVNSYRVWRLVRGTAAPDAGDVSWEPNEGVLDAAGLRLATSAAELKVWVKIGDCHLFLRCFQDAFQALGILFERFFQLTLEHAFRYFEEALRFAFDVRGHFGARA